MATQMWAKIQAVKWWVWVGLGFVVLIIVGQVGGGGAESPQEKVEAEQGDVIANHGRERAIAYFSEGVTLLALEYGIRLDEDVVRAMMSDDETAFTDMGAGDFLVLTFFDWWDSPSDKADMVRDALLESGTIPSEATQRFADRVAAYQESH